MKENSIEEDMKILEGIIKGDEDCINAIYSQMKVKNDNDEDIQYYKKEIQSVKNIVDNYLKEKARADKLEKEYSAMLTESDENECDYKRVLEINEVLLKENEQLSTEVNSLKKENEELRIKNNAIKRESEVYAEHMIRLDNELNLEKEKSKYEWIRQNCLPQELVNKLYIPIQKIKDKIEKEIKYHERNILDIENITMLKSKTAKEEAEIEFNKYAIVVLKKILQKLIKEREEEHNGK